MTQAMGQAGSAPSRWASAYASPPRRHDFRAGGLHLAASVWDLADEGVDVIALHGGAAQREWWDHLAPLLRGVRRVVAPDLSGHGDSDRREVYAIDTWTDEVAQVASELCAGRPALLGHSMGGLVALNAAQRDAELYAGVLALDSPLRRGSAGNLERRQKIAARPVRSFETRAEALRGYKTAPPVTDAPPEVWEHITAAAYRQVGERWQLKFDPRIYARPQVDDSFVRPARIPTWWIQAEGGYVDERMAAVIGSTIGPLGRVVPIPHAAHHMVLEQPLATTWVLNAFLSTFERTH